MHFLIDLVQTKDDRMNEDRKRRCVCCGSERLLTGKHLPGGYSSERRFSLVPMRVKSLACVDCGYIGFYLGTSDLAGLQKQYEKLSEQNE